MASLRCWQGEELVWCLYSGSRGGCLNSEQSERPPLASWLGAGTPSYSGLFKGESPDWALWVPQGQAAGLHWSSGDLVPAYAQLPL